MTSIQINGNGDVPLHSTMFSINQYSDTAAGVARITLHSTMFSINLSWLICFLWLNFLYIPLCFLLIICGANTKSYTGCLYIPLCFLLINAIPREISPTVPPLHSTMFSINLRDSGTLQLEEILYIPLCFLLISRVSVLSWGLISLYIPLCFLLIAGLRPAFSVWIAFTFHYVFY